MKKLSVGLGLLAVVLAVILGIQVAQKNDVNQKLQDQKASVTALEKDTADAKAALTGAQEAATKLEEEKAALEQEKADLEKAVADADSKLSESSKELEGVKAALATAEDGLKKAQEEALAAGAEGSSFKDSLAEVQATVTSLTEEKGALAGELEVLKAKFDELEAASTALMAERDKLKKSLDEKQAEYLTLMKKFVALNNEHKELVAAQAQAPEVVEAGAAADKLEPVTISLYHTNDTHSRVTGNDKDQIGFAKVATIVREARKEHPVLLLDAGDTLHGMSFANMVEGESVVKLMNLLGYDAMEPGNHDFNYGYQRLKELEGEMNFDLVNSNLQMDGKNSFKPYTVLELAGKRIGVVGVANPQMESAILPDHIKGLVFGGLDLVEKAVADVRAEGVDAVIMLAHWGADDAYDPNSSILAKLEGVDLVIDGHSHTAYEDIQQVEGGAVIVSAKQYLQVLGHVLLNFDADNKLTIDVKPIVFTDTVDVEPDAEILQVIEEINKGMEEVLGRVVGKTKVLLDGERANVRTMETNLGDLAADALRLSMGADIAFTNGGGIRTSVPEGDITKGKLVEVFPFGNSVVLIEITGDKILAAMEHGLRLYPEQNGGFPQISGAVLTFDPEEEPGERVVAMKIDGKDVDPAATYRMATNDFTAAGGDDYLMLKDCPVIAYGGTLDEALIQHIQTLGELELEAEGRIKMVGEAKPEEPEAEEKGLELTLEQLAEFNGKDGKPAYVAVDGIIYDVSENAPWKGGTHNGYEAGRDLTVEIKTKSPHGVGKLQLTKEVGRIVP